jgi:Ca2+-binding RTX toxin-like protein
MHMVKARLFCEARSDGLRSRRIGARQEDNMTTGTNGPDILGNDPDVQFETVLGLDGDDRITIVTPTTLGSPAPGVTVAGGNGFDTLIVNASGQFDNIAGNQIMIRFGETQSYTVNFETIERLELTGTLFGNLFGLGDEIDVLRFTSSTARAVIVTNGGNDDVALTGTFISVNPILGEGNDIADLRGVTGVLESIGAQGGGGNDILYSSALSIPDSLFGEEGNDALIFGASLTGEDLANGGAGIDTLVIQGNYPSLSLDAGMIDVEVLLVASGNDPRFGQTVGNSYDYTITASNLVTASGGMLTVSATFLKQDEDLVFFANAVTDFSIRIFTGRGTDALTGGAGQDGFLFGAEGNLTAADRIDGLGGTDSLALRGFYDGPDAIVFDDESFVNVEVMVLLSGLTTELGGLIVPGGFDYDLTLADGNVAAGQRLDIVGTNLSGTERMTIDASDETNGSVRILAGASNDILTGSANADSIYGGIGADVLTGGGGADLYLYRAVAESTAASRDTVTFGAGDRIDLSVIDGDGAGPANAFAFIGSSAFSNVAGQLRAFSSGVDQFTVEGDTDGDGTADLVITVNSAVPLVAADFVL